MTVPWFPLLLVALLILVALVFAVVENRPQYPRTSHYQEPGK